MQYISPFSYWIFRYRPPTCSGRSPDPLAFTNRSRASGARRSTIRKLSGRRFPLIREKQKGFKTPQEENSSIRFSSSSSSE